jgi:tetrapyrrole methylase family protein/MazG family protein
MENSKEVIKELLSKNNYNFDDLCNLVSVLRSEEGCPWDREQTNKSIRNCIIDETYEFIEGLDTDDDKLMCEELGDVLFQVVFHSDIKQDNNVFDIGNVIDGICKKMILRHPHVFGTVNVADSAEVLVNWENIKNDEKQRKTPLEQLQSVSKALPSLMRAQKLQSKAAKNNLIEKASFDTAIEEAEKAHEIRNKRNLVHAKLCMKSDDVNEETCRQVIEYLKDVLRTRGIQ